MPEFHVSALVCATVDLGTYEAADADAAERAAFAEHGTPALCPCCAARFTALELEHAMVEPAAGREPDVLWRDAEPFSGGVNEDLAAIDGRKVRCSPSFLERVRHYHGLTHHVWAATSNVEKSDLIRGYESSGDR